MPSVGAISGDFDDFMEPRLIDGQRIRLPRCNARLAEIHNRYFDVRVLFGDNGTRRTALFGMRLAEDFGRRKWLAVR